MWYQWIKFAPPRAPPLFLSGFSDDEPLLSDVLADPIIHRMMACDHVDMTALVALIDRTQRRLQ